MQSAGPGTRAGRMIRASREYLISTDPAIENGCSLRDLEHIDQDLLLPPTRKDNL